MNVRNRTAPQSLILVLLLTLAAHAQSPAPHETVRFESKLVGRTLPFVAVLPPGYERRESAATRYPVLYLLH